MECTRHDGRPIVVFDAFHKLMDRGEAVA